MHIALIIIIFLVSCLALAKSSSALVGNIKNIAGFLGMSVFTVSFLIMATATSLPELVVGVMSAARNESVLVLGTVLGSNIADLTLVAGLAATFARGILIEKRINREDIFFMNLAAFAPLILLWDGRLSRTDGVLLLVLYLFYILKLLREQKGYSQKEIAANSIVKNIAQFIFWVGLLVGSAYGIVETAQRIATLLKIPLVLVGIFAVAIGTSLPELTFEIKAMRKQQGGMAFGDLLGSVIANSTLILGITALIRPIQIRHFPLFAISSIFLVLTALLFSSFLRSGHRLSWKEGMGLVLLYSLFIVVELLVNGSTAVILE